MLLHIYDIYYYIFQEEYLTVNISYLNIKIQNVRHKFIIMLLTHMLLIFHKIYYK